jgi:hypothetical protein
MTPGATATAGEDRSRRDTLYDDSSYFYHASQQNQWTTEDTEELCSQFLAYNSSCSSAGRSSPDERSSSAEKSRSSTPVAGASVYQWGRAETVLLLRLYQAHSVELKDKKRKNLRKVVFGKKIAEELNSKGYNVTGLQCTNRFKTLKSLFRRTVGQHKKTGLQLFMTAVIDCITGCF